MVRKAKTVEVPAKPAKKTIAPSLEATSPAVGRDASVLLRVKELKPIHLTPEFLARIHRVAGSALTQRGPKISTARAQQAYQRLMDKLEKVPATDKQREAMKADLESAVAPVFPRKS